VVPKVMASIRLVTDGVLYGQTTPQPGHEGIPNHRECAGKAGDHRRTPKAHLSPRQHIANKGGENTQEQEEHTHTPHKHAPCMAQSEAAEQMQAPTGCRVRVSCPQAQRWPMRVHPRLHAKPSPSLRP